MQLSSGVQLTESAFQQRLPLQIRARQTAVAESIGVRIVISPQWWSTEGQYTFSFDLLRMRCIGASVTRSSHHDAKRSTAGALWPMTATHGYSRSLVRRMLRGLLNDKSQLGNFRVRYYSKRP